MAADAAEVGDDDVEAPALEPWGGHLIVPVHPQYQMDADPFDQPEYVNPVTLNNYQVLYANALIELSQKVHVWNKQIATLKVRKSRLEGYFEDIDTWALRKRPPKDKDVKNLKMTTAYIQGVIHEEGRGDEFDAAMAELRTINTRLVYLYEKVNGAKMWLENIKTSAEHGRTHLSYVKDEARRSGAAR